MPQPLSQSDIDRALEDLPGWTFEDDALVRSFEFEDFRTAVGVIVRIGFEAETMNHHPELTNVYNKLRVRLTTHDAGDRVTERDVQLARRIASVANG